MMETLTLDDPRYPRLLKEIPDPPAVLYVQATDLSLPLERTIAVVGTRRVTPYGAAVTRNLTRGLVNKGFTIVSGMALGVDTIAHRTALDCGGRTIAVLGCGIDIIYPPSNARLYRAICETPGSSVVSEFPRGVQPSREQFPLRNRIISGLSLAVVVTEGDERSGTLITARLAAEQGRDVFAVPGPVTSKMSRAPAILIKQGAKLVENAEDIIEELTMYVTPPNPLLK